MVALALVAILLNGCSDDEPRAAVVPELRPTWSVPGLDANPGVTGPHHWMTHRSRRNGVGWGTTYSAGPLLVVDARTGTTHTVRIGGDWPCGMPSRISSSGVTPVLSAARVEQPYPGASHLTEPCTRATVLDATTGAVLWRADPIALTGLSERRLLGADDRVTAVVDDRGRSRCFGARDGSEVDGDDASCRALVEHLTHDDLPDLVDADGAPAPLGFGSDTTPSEVGRTDDVLLVRAEGADGTPVVRAHDLTTGRTLWQDELSPDPSGSESWSRTEAWFAARQSVIHVTYEHPLAGLGGAAAHRTPMVLTLADARTGRDLRRIATVEGAWFNHQFGDVTVALTEQEKGLRSTISGFELPDW